MEPAALRTDNLTKRYGEAYALKDFSIAVRQNEVYGLVGRNGAGKTTFFKCVAGVAAPQAGTVELCGEPPNRRAARKRMGLMINPSFFSYLGPYENLTYMARVKGVGAKGEVRRLLSLVGLEGVRKPFKAFSLGMKQRLGIAGALLGSPQLVALDEPINGLDPKGIVEIRELVKELHANFGTTFVISSHILSELDLVATRFGFIEQGSLVGEITREELHRQTGSVLEIEAGDIKAALSALESIGITGAEAANGRIRLREQIDQPHRIARALVEAGVEVRDLHRKETMLEEYFLRLIGGGASD
ncbi:MAG: ABC transporter ATP-binding protein [Defluviitaleaceae bacterium]|nr:ABC transporter ATP-binding protein [Defluviitaleaceae bacterium]